MGLCFCRKTTRKAGPNQGRDFFCCVNSRCNYFTWVDSEPNTSTGVSSPFTGGFSSGNLMSQHPVGDRPFVHKDTVARSQCNDVMAAGSRTFPTVMCDCGQLAAR